MRRTGFPIKPILTILGIGITTCLPAGTARAGEPELVQRAIEATVVDIDDGWAYTETAVKDGRETVARFDPRLPVGERWALISVDGRPPTEKERSKFAKGRPSTDGDPDPDPSAEEEHEIRAVIQRESLELMEENDEYALYRFSPVAEDEEDEKIFLHLDGTLKIIKEGPYVETIDMRSPGPFKVGFGMKIKEFSMVLKFEPIAPGGPALPRSERVHILGRAMMIMKLREDVEVTYGDYEQVGE